MPNQRLEPFPIRGTDFDPETNILYTGDEAGYLQKWDLTNLLEKLRMNESTYQARNDAERENARAQVNVRKHGSATFVTEIEELKYEESDVQEQEPWKAHEDSISCVTYIQDLRLLASCAYDQHVYMWDVEGDKKEQVGSLLLGKKKLQKD